MPTDVSGYLASKGLTLKRADSRNVHLACPFCNEPEGKRGRMYVNVDEDAEIPGLFFCHLCGERGSLKKIQRFYGDDTSNGPDAGTVHYEIMRAAAHSFYMNLAHHPEALQYFKDRGLTEGTIKKFKLGWAEGDIVPQLKKLGHTEDAIKAAGFIKSDGREFYNQVYTIPYYVGGTCVGIRQKEPGGKYKQPQGYSQRLFNTDAARGADEIVITEGEFDCMIAEQLGFAAIGCPGSSQWQESWNGYVRDAKRVFTVFDNDEAGRKGAEKIREKVGPRCIPLTIPPAPGGDAEDHNDLSDWIVVQGHTQADFQALLKKHKPTLLITVTEAMSEWESVQGLEGLKFNFEALDTMLSPGLLPGQVVVALAKTNTGKTLWLLNTFERMAMLDDNLKFLFLSLEQTRGDWFERSQRIRGFYSLFEEGPNDFSDEEMERYNQEIRKRTFNFWKDRFMMTDKNQMTEDQIRESIDDYTVEMGRKPDVVAIDYLGYLARSFKGKDRSEKTSEAIMSIKALAKDYDIPILLPHQVNRQGQFGQKLEIDMARNAGEVEETADFVFVLYNPDHNKKEDEPRTGNINLHIGKSRHGGKEREIHYQFARQSLVMVPPDDKTFYKMACQELSLRDEPWQWTIARHRTGRRPPVAR